tara:strand:- start:439 stop:648 length:210 start_codon:yes stop_codon:yes gene_type:complete
MGIIKRDKSVKELFYITKEELIKLIAKDMEVPESEITISTKEEDTSNVMDRYPSMQFVGINITRSFESS